MSLTLSKLNSILLEIFPKSWACDWDNVGLIVGNPKSEIKNILLALEITSDVINEAVRKKVQAIITHHPPYLKPPQKLLYSDTIGNTLVNLIKNDIGLISLHTNVDHSPEGTNFFLGKEIGLTKIKFINPYFKTQKFKYCVFVPVTHIKKITEAINSGGGGVIGNYSHCTFYTEGTGTFTPLKEAKPFIGAQNKFEEVKECRIESIVPSQNLSNVIQEVKNVHPYEEPAFDVYPLHPTDAEYGLGIIGSLNSNETLKQFIKRLKRILDVEKLCVVIKKISYMKNKIKKVAICTGSGGEFIKELSPDIVDVYITGEARYHDLLDASEKGLNVILGGHYATEKIFTKILITQLSSHKLIMDNKVKIFVSKKMSDPIKII